MGELGWEDLTQPPYNSDLSPTDYHLFALEILLTDTNQEKTVKINYFRLSLVGIGALTAYY